MIELAPQSEKIMTYEEALLYCSFLDHDGNRDWRIPTFEEWIEHRFDVSPKDKLYRWYVGRDQGAPTLNDLLPHKWFVAPVRDI